MTCHTATEPAMHDAVNPGVSVTDMVPFCAQTGVKRKRNVADDFSWTEHVTSPCKSSRPIVEPGTQASPTGVFDQWAWVDGMLPQSAMPAFLGQPGQPVSPFAHPLDAQRADANTAGPVPPPLHPRPLPPHTLRANLSVSSSCSDLRTALSSSCCSSSSGAALDRACEEAMMDLPDDHDWGWFVAEEEPSPAKPGVPRPSSAATPHGVPYRVPHTSHVGVPHGVPHGPGPLPPTGVAVAPHPRRLHFNQHEAIPAPHDTAPLADHEDELNDIDLDWLWTAP